VLALKSAVLVEPGVAIRDVSEGDDFSEVVEDEMVVVLDKLCAVWAQRFSIECNFDSFTTGVCNLSSYEQ
jgi:hypothetical protein